MSDLLPLVPPESSVLASYDLPAMVGVPPVTPTMGGILYPGAVHSISGEPGLGKTWIALGLLAMVLRDGRKGILVDFEDGPHTALRRMGVLGADVTSLGPPFYQRPTGALHSDDPGLSWLVELVGVLQVALVVIDSVPEALAACSLDENFSGDVTKWFQQIARPLARAGAAVLCIDHVAKANGDHRRWPRGSGAKLAAVDGAAYTFELVEPFSTHRSGSGALKVQKDRHGGVGGMGDIVRTVRFDVAAGSLHRVRLEPWGGSPIDPGPDDGWAGEPFSDVDRESPA